MFKFRILIIFYFLKYCLYCRVFPLNFLALNIKYFNQKLGLFSKIDLDKIIPRKWRVKTGLIENIDLKKINFPLFLKPLWGQNSQGVILVKNISELKNKQKKLKNSKTPYLYQSGILEKKEFEIFYIRDSKDFSKIKMLSVTETLNSGKNPINGIYNKKTSYKDLTKTLKKEDIKKLQNFILEFGDLGMARIGVKSENLKNLINGDFKVIEINVFLPMPLRILDKNIKFKNHKKFINNFSKNLVKLIKVRKPKLKFKIFLQQLKSF